MYINESLVRENAKRYRQMSGRDIGTIIKEQSQRPGRTYDIFLSHSSSDKEIVTGIYAILTSNNLEIFVDWIESPQSHRREVSGKNAEWIRKNMNNSKSMLVIDSENAEESKWICWEVGSFDGQNTGPIGILRLNSSSPKASGREFLELYPEISLDQAGTFFVNEAPRKRVEFRTTARPNRQHLKEWIKQPNPNLRAF